MNKISQLPFLIAILLLIFVACTPSGGSASEPTAPPPPTDDNPAGALETVPTEQTLFVQPYMRQCEGFAPQLCLLVSDSETAEPSFFYDQIEGFSFIWGTLSELRVSVTEIENPPADGSSVRYELLEIVHSEQTTDATVELTLSTLFITPLENGRFQIGNHEQFVCNSDCEQFANEVNSKDELTLTLQYPTQNGDPLTLLNWQSATNSQGGGIESSSWILTSLNGRNLLPASEITLEIDGGALGGFAGCNSYGGNGTLKSGVVNIGELAITEQACIQPDGIMEQEAAFMVALQQSQTYEQADGMLTFFDQSGSTTLQFVPQTGSSASVQPDPTLTNILWRVVAYGDGAEATFPVVGSEPTMQFDDEGRVAIFTGCNQATAGYSIVDETVEFTAIAMTLMACTETAVNEQEQAILDLLPQMTQFSLDENGLILTDDGGDLVISMIKSD